MLTLEEKLSQVILEWERMQEPPKLTEDQVRSLVGAPSVLESETCECGKSLNNCPEAYEHMTHGY